MAKKRELKKYRTYMFNDQDPIVSETLRLMNGSTFGEASKRSGVSATTLSNWKRKKTKRPQFCTIAAIGGAFGQELVWRRK